jgi:hypothetical protein
MFFENNYISFSDKLNITTIIPYRNIMIKFINKYIILNFINYKNINELFLDAIIYSKYYVNYKLLNCKYSNEIMEIIYNNDYK